MVCSHEPVFSKSRYLEYKKKAWETEVVQNYWRKPLVVALKILMNVSVLRGKRNPFLQNEQLLQTKFVSSVTYPLTLWTAKRSNMGLLRLTKEPSLQCVAQQNTPVVKNPTRKLNLRMLWEPFGVEILRAQNGYEVLLQLPKCIFLPGVWLSFSSILHETTLSVF